MTTRPLPLSGLPLAIGLLGPLTAHAEDVYPDDQVLLRFADGVGDDEKDWIRGSIIGITIEADFASGMELLQLEGMGADDAIALFECDERVALIQPNYLIPLEGTPNDPSFSSQWSLHNTGQTGGTPGADIDAPEAWDTKTTTAAVVAVIDSGVDLTHPDLASTVWTNTGEVPGNAIDDDLNGYIDDVQGWDFWSGDADPSDNDGHGTHIAGIVGALGNDAVGMSGVGWETGLMALRVGDNGWVSTSAVAKAIDYAVANGAIVLNLSFGGTSWNQAMYDHLELARDAGVLAVAAAGNYGWDIDSYPVYPAAYDLDNLIVVAATDHNDALPFYSDYGAVAVDLGAPGHDIYSTLPGGTYGSMSGTSMAAPHVAGAAALVWAMDSGATYSEVRSAIFAGVDAKAALSGAVATGGRLNLAGALAALACGPPTAGTWNVLADCTIGTAVVVPGDVEIASGVTLTITGTGAITTDFSAYHVRIGDGSAIRIEPGGRLDG